MVYILAYKRKLCFLRDHIKILQLILPNLKNYLIFSIFLKTSSDNKSSLT